ncbi:MAG: hypothetical protein AAFR38_05620 [Planctomycetota bacterium]
MPTIHNLAAAVLMFVAPALAPALAQPSLNPPSGAVGLSQVFGPGTAINSRNTPGDGNSRFKITQPGHYHLASNIRVIDLPFLEQPIAIEIAASDVTIDLNGFTLSRGPLISPGQTEPEDPVAGEDTVGIGVDDQDVRNITIRNGTIYGFATAVGLRRQAGGFSTVSARESVLADLRIRDALRTGARAITIGTNADIERCVVRSQNSGISAGSGLVLRDSRIEADADGVLSADALIESCRIASGGNAIDASDAIIRDSWIQANGAVIVTNQAVIEGCRIQSDADINGPPAVRLGNGLIHGCTIISSATPIDFQIEGAIADTVAIGGTSNIASGVFVTGSKL